MHTGPDFVTLGAMKKICTILFALLLCVFATAALSAHTGIGFQGDFSFQSDLPCDAAFSGDAGFSLSLAADSTPWVFSLQMRFKPLYAGFTADNWLVYQPLGRAASFFLFYGTSGGFELEDSRALLMGPRLGAGLNIFFLRRHLEFYAQAAWNPFMGVNLKTDGDSCGRFVLRPLVFPVAGGVRFWL